jgi:hypothetical protein
LRDVAATHVCVVSGYASFDGFGKMVACRAFPGILFINNLIGDVDMNITISLNMLRPSTIRELATDVVIAIDDGFYAEDLDALQKLYANLDQELWENTGEHLPKLHERIYETE